MWPSHWPVAATLVFVSGFLPGISRHVVWNLLRLLYPRSGEKSRTFAFFWSLGVVNGTLSDPVRR